jgi:hypothetical protein
MADYCAECADRLFGSAKFGGLVGLCEEGECVVVLCEGCGTVVIDHTGTVCRDDKAKTIIESLRELGVTVV